MAGFVQGVQLRGSSVPKSAQGASVPRSAEARKSLSPRRKPWIIDERRESPVRGDTSRTHAPAAVVSPLGAQPAFIGLPTAYAVGSFAPPALFGSFVDWSRVRVPARVPGKVSGRGFRATVTGEVSMQWLRHRIHAYSCKAPQGSLHSIGSPRNVTRLCRKCCLPPHFAHLRAPCVKTFPTGQRVTFVSKLRLHDCRFHSLKRPSQWRSLHGPLDA